MPDDGTSSRNTRRGVLASTAAFWHGGTVDPAKAGPRVLWQMLRWPFLLHFTAMAAWISRGTLANLAGMKPPGFTLSTVVVAVLVLIALTQGLRARRFQKHALSVEYRVCPECGYSLVDLDEEGTCPECGTAYTPAGLSEVWNRK